MAVYFVRAGADGYIKIGHSKNVKNRIKDLQTASPVPLDVMCVIDGDKRMETELHRRFAKHRDHGEWFRPGIDLLNFIRELRGEPPLEDTIACAREFGLVDVRWL